MAILKIFSKISHIIVKIKLLLFKKIKIDNNNDDDDGDDYCVICYSN